MTATHYRQITSCRVCGNRSLTPILNLGTQALTGVFPRTPTEEVPAGPIELVKCVDAADGCGLVQLAHTYAFDQMYGMNYGYRSGLNRGMVAHLGHKVDRIREIAHLEPGDVVIDIGSNDGTLLSAYPADLDRIGIDPTGVKFRKFYPPGVRLVEDFFSARAIDGALGGKKAKVVTSIAMFYDLEEPIAFADDVRRVLADDGLWIFEQSYLPTMIERLAYDTVAHEHLEFYCVKQIDFILSRAGFKIVDVELNDVNGGSFSIAAAKRESSRPRATSQVQQLLGRELSMGLHERTVYDSFAANVAWHRARLYGFVQGVRRAGKRVFGYGASTKGNVVLQYCRLTAEHIEAVAEVNEDKFGCYTPGSKIPIVPEATMRAAQPDYLLVLPWHFREGFIKREAEYLNKGGRLVFALPHFSIIEHDFRGELLP